ncbi:hypothetical protein CHELA40_10988 [Chelatococcus asaccharovorans]|nr:hypothetical protein CHELA40_10988 [Chelatococcus asaccharovorans]CAH1685647.1 hypothetical protein CHELA17_64611 [Chelatococcus asaccharovorans]
MVRRRHVHPPDTGLGANVGLTRTTSKLLVLVELLNLTFDPEPHVRRDSHVKFAPRAGVWSGFERRRQGNGAYPGGGRRGSHPRYALSLFRRRGLQSHLGRWRPVHARRARARTGRPRPARSHDAR